MRRCLHSPEPPGSSVIVPDTVTGTNLPFGGHNIAGFAETVITGGVVSSPKQVARETSRLPSGFSPVRSALDRNAMRVPAALIVGEPEKMALPVAVVTWVKVLVVVSKRKSSWLASAFSPVRFRLELKAMASASIVDREGGDLRREVHIEYLRSPGRK